MDRYDRFDFTNTPTSEQRPAFHYVPKDPSVKPAVSIVTAFFNTGSVFKETAQSVFNQSFQQWEWIIINDGSSDSEAQSVLNEYRGIDPRIRIIDLPDNLGPANAYNVGFQEAKTEYVVKLDSDDPSGTHRRGTMALVHDFVSGACICQGVLDRFRLTRISLETRF